MSVSLVALRCRTSDRTPAAGRGVDTLAALIGKRLGLEPRQIGSPGDPRESSWDDDLRDSRGCLLEAGGQVDDALEGGRLPVLLAGECAIGLTTLPTVLRHRPDTVVLWLDAHGDFNTPDTTVTGTLSGMALAGACGLWDSGLTPDAVPEDRAVLAGVRDLDDRERKALELSDVTVIGASPIETLVAVKNALNGAPVYVHLDLDVLDPEVLPARDPAPGGLAPEKLFDLLEAVTGDCELVGVEVTTFEAPDDEEDRQEAAAVVMRVLEPILEAIPETAGRGG
ncbi:MAG: arginase family protein [Thermoleophilaceae bacterium]